MASSLSRGSRPIGPIYNDANREARKLERKGYGRAAEEMALLASKQKLARGGSNITSAESNRDERDGLEVAQSGLMRAKRDAVLRDEAADAGLTVEATGAQLTARKGLYDRMRGGITPEMKSEAAKLGITDSGFAQASASASKNPRTTMELRPEDGVMPPGTLTRRSSAPGLGRGNPNGNAAAPAVTVDVDGNTTAPADNSPVRPATPSLGARPAPTPPVGKIDGLPASQVIAENQARANKDATQGRIDSMGLDGAIADYYKRANGPQEPGNMADIRKRDGVPDPIKPATPGPLQTAMLEARKRREARDAADKKKPQ